MILSIDLETYSDVDLAKCGVYSYVDSPNFTILLFAYAFEEEETKIVDLACGEKLPQKVLDALLEERVIKTAYNATFERTCLARYLGVPLSPVSWQCSAVQAAMLGLPLSLDGVGEVLNLGQKKLKEGAGLIRYFSVPSKPSQAKGGRRRNLPEHAPERWELFKAYCIRDVEVEREIRRKLRNFPIPESEKKLYWLDQEINDRGILVDRDLVRHAVECDLQYKARLKARAYELTGLNNLNSVAQVKRWLAQRGVQVQRLDKKSVKGLLSKNQGRVSGELKAPGILERSDVSESLGASRVLETADAQELLGALRLSGASEVSKTPKEGEALKISEPSGALRILEVSDVSKVSEVLKLRLLMAKTSIKKYEAIERSVCSDGRVHGLLQFYGANRTGRWAGRLVQVQNLPQNHLPDLALARRLIKEGRYEEVELFFDSTPGVLSELIRTAFVPKPGTRFIVADFSAIEARVLAWLSGEKWRLEVFASHGKIYEASASAMFGVPVAEITKDSPLRQKGKIAELALGYGGSVGALISMGALDMGLTEEELPVLVNQWRKANPHITRFWWEVDRAALTAVREKKDMVVGRVRFSYQSGVLFVRLPSGRRLSYWKPKLEINPFGREGLTYEGIGEGKKWRRIETYGPKLVENIVQATSRDLLAQAMLRLRSKGFKICMHIHDEVVLEVPKGKSSVEEVCELMSLTPEWASGLPLRTEGYECDFYRKS